jgi:hypothetical protein
MITEQSSQYHVARLGENSRDNAKPDNDSRYDVKGRRSGDNWRARVTTRDEAGCHREVLDSWIRREIISERPLFRSPYLSRRDIKAENSTQLVHNTAAGSDTCGYLVLERLGRADTGTIGPGTG